MFYRTFLGILLFLSTCALKNTEASGLSPSEIITAQDNPSLWLNSPPLTRNNLRNKVVLVEFWTFDCINCKNTLPYMKKWYEDYKSKGLIVIGIHSPELRHERELINVKQAMLNNGILYPVLIDNNFNVWKGLHTRFWPTIHVLDQKGEIVHTQVGEGAYEATERVIRQLLSGFD